MRPTTPPVLRPVDSNAPPTQRRTGRRAALAGLGPAAVTLRVERLVKGKRRAVGTLRRTATTGANRVRFSGRIGRKALPGGRYRLTVRATDAAGNRSAPRTASFRIVR